MTADPRKPEGRFTNRPSIANRSRVDQMNMPHEHRIGVRCIALDFDGTLISEHVLIAWVLFLLRHSGWPAKRRLSFLVKSVFRGGAAMIVSRRPAWAPWAVRTAFGAFAGVEKKTLADLVYFRANGRPAKKKHVLNLNPAVMALLKSIVKSCGIHPEIRVYSQGSSREVIQQFLERADVRDRFNEIGVSAASVAVHANGMAIDGGGRFTGAIQEDIVTKFSRLRAMPDQSVFIGDDEDENVFKQLGGGCTIRFVNWRRWQDDERKRAGV